MAVGMPLVQHCQYSHPSPWGLVSWYTCHCKAFFTGDSVPDPGCLNREEYTPRANSSTRVFIHTLYNLGCSLQDKDFLILHNNKISLLAHNNP